MTNLVNLHIGLISYSTVLKDVFPVYGFQLLMETFVFQLFIGLCYSKCIIERCVPCLWFSVTPGNICVSVIHRAVL